jgi:hypothetical protein
MGVFGTEGLETSCAAIKTFQLSDNSQVAAIHRKLRLSNTISPKNLPIDFGKNPHFNTGNAQRKMCPKSSLSSV